MSMNKFIIKRDEMMSFIPLFVVCDGNTYDYEDESTTTYSLNKAIKWAETKKVAILDACDFSYYGLL